VASASSAPSSAIDSTRVAIGTTWIVDMPSARIATPVPLTKLGSRCRSGRLSVVQWRHSPRRDGGALQLEALVNCEHINQLPGVDNLAPPRDVCESCIEIGGTWVNLRQCLACGRTGCCDNSPNTHATKHWQATGHPVIRSAGPGETWAWCYPDEVPYVPGEQGWEPYVEK
jgi:hypothetical protein